MFNSLKEFHHYLYINHRPQLRILIISLDKLHAISFCCQLTSRGRRMWCRVHPWSCEPVRRQLSLPCTEEEMWLRISRGHEWIMRNHIGRSRASLTVRKTKTWCLGWNFIICHYSHMSGNPFAILVQFRWYRWSTCQWQGELHPFELKLIWGLCKCSKTLCPPSFTGCM